MMGYRRLFTIITTLIVVMDGLMYLNTYEPVHIWFSQTRIWMALYMGAVITAIMMTFMWSMCPASAPMRQVEGIR